MAESTQIDSPSLSESACQLRRCIIDHLTIRDHHRREAAGKYTAAHPGVARRGGVSRIILDDAVGDGNRSAAPWIGESEAAAVTIGRRIVRDRAVCDRQSPGSVKSSTPIQSSAKFVAGSCRERIFSKLDCEVGEAGIES